MDVRLPAATDRRSPRPLARQAYAAFVAESVVSFGAPARDVQPDAGLCARTVVMRAGDSEATPTTATAAATMPPLRTRVGDRVHVNVCTHACIMPPTTAGGRRAPDAEVALGRPLPLRDLLSLAITLAVGPLRRVAGDASAWAIDVIVHPWTLAAARAEPRFEHELVAFAARCVGEERGLRLADAPPHLVVERDVAYVDGCPFAALRSGAGGATAGHAASGATPWPFDVTRLQPPAKMTIPEGAAGRTEGSVAGAHTAAVSDPTVSTSGARGDNRVVATVTAAAGPRGTSLAHASPGAVLQAVGAGRSPAVLPSAGAGPRPSSEDTIGLTPTATTTQRSGMTWTLRTDAAAATGAALELVVHLPDAVVDTADLRAVGVEVDADVAVVTLPPLRRVNEGATPHRDLVVPWPARIDVASVVARRRGRALTVTAVAAETWKIRR